MLGGVGLGPLTPFLAPRGGSGDPQSLTEGLCFGALASRRAFAAAPPLNASGERGQGGGGGGRDGAGV